MKRRDFLKAGSVLASVPFFSNKIVASVLNPSLQEAAMLSMAANDGRVLIVIQLEGGNDGLNTVIPLDQYTNLANARSSILIPQNQVLQLGNFQTGLHPSLTGLKTIYDEQRLCVVQGVGYAQPSLSHFRAADIFMSGSDSDEVIDSGWLGRYLEYEFPGFPENYPNATMPHPLSIHLGSTVSRGLMGYGTSTGQTVSTQFNGSITQLQSAFTNTTIPNTNAGFEIDFLRKQQLYTNQYGQAIVDAWAAGANSLAYTASPSGIYSALGNQLRIAARLVKGGLKTRVFWCRAGGYDTHSGQLPIHANLMTELSNAISEFQRDIRAMGMEDRFLGMTFSEFGRRIKANGSSGTDHGDSAPMFLFGKSVNPTIVGANAMIPTNPSTSATPTIQYDYRQIYMSVLRNWFCVGQTDAETILQHTQSPLAGTVNPVCSPLTPLPLELVRFEVTKANKQDADTDWTTMNESNISHFEVQRSLDGRSFAKIATVKAIGHSHTAQRYHYLDEKLPVTKTQTVFYYRLKINELDESSTYSEIRSVAFEGQRVAGITAEVFPNPVLNGKIQVVIQGDVRVENATEIILTDLYGRLVLHDFQNVAAATHLELDISNVAATNGVYFLTLRNGGQSTVQKIVVQ
ncbi:MAG: hypothetical protein RIS64_2924 [Bacteroidota bacterium]|jgi:uncharacterized protein (DUF1501 family)